MTRFERRYIDGRPPWDIDRPQGSLICLHEAGEIRGSVLDVAAAG